MFKTIEAQSPSPTFLTPDSLGARLVSYEELRGSGWSKKMIVRFLGGAWRSYSLDVVEKVEASPHFRAAWTRAFRKRCLMS